MVVWNGLEGSNSQVLVRIVSFIIIVAGQFGQRPV